MNFTFRVQPLHIFAYPYTMAALATHRWLDVTSDSTVDRFRFFGLNLYFRNSFGYICFLWCLFILLQHTGLYFLFSVLYVYFICLIAFIRLVSISIFWLYFWFRALFVISKCRNQKFMRKSTQTEMQWFPTKCKKFRNDFRWPMLLKNHWFYSKSEMQWFEMQWFLQCFFFTTIL